MAVCSSNWMTLFLVLLVVEEMQQAGALEPATKSRKSRVESTESNNKLQTPQVWPHRHRSGHHRKQGLAKRERANAMLLRGPGPRKVDLEDPGIESLTPVRLEMDGPRRSSALQEEKEEFLGFDFPYPGRDNEPPGSESILKGRKHSREHRKLNRKDRLRHQKGKQRPPSIFKELETFEEKTQAPLAKQLSPTPGPTSAITVTTTLLTLSTMEETPAVPLPSTRPKARVKADGDVMPTLDMALFDWTDYEDLKPEMWPSVKKKEKRRSKSLSIGNLTSLAEPEPCDHHLDCLPGNCCDLRQHVCKPHNRGLNNKCFDDCMCAEGFRCYAKFHRNRRVTRRKGRCVEPDTVSNDQGSFITV
ncbi:draxin [Latimeria chalumnae]|uniref:draxin n=1 Tax=Latimeria chalumnae TaxID=7897 RepID=UPI00313EB9A4